MKKSLPFSQYHIDPKEEDYTFGLEGSARPIGLTARLIHLLHMPGHLIEAVGILVAFYRTEAKEAEKKELKRQDRELSKELRELM